MLAAAIGALLGSMGAAYLLGYAFVAPRDSFLRSKTGIWLLIALVVSVLLLPPQLTAIEPSLGPLATAVPGLDLSWPAAIGQTTYLIVWFVLTMLSALAGARIWQAGKPGWREGRDEDRGPSGRLRGLLPLADTLPEALDTLRRVSLSAKDAEKAAAEIREIGRRFSAEMPERDADVYAMVASRVPVAVATPVTGYLLEGADRTRPSA